MGSVNKSEYESLLRDSIKLSCLEACGVDNWEGWDDAMKMYHEEMEGENAKERELSISGRGPTQEAFSRIE